MNPYGRAKSESPLRSIFSPYQYADAVKHFACRDRRPRRSGEQQILLFKRLPIIAGCKLKILSFFGPSRTPVPTGKKFKPHQHTDTERKPYRFRGVEVSLRLVSQGDLPSANSRSDTTPWCHSLRSRRFATSTPTGKKFKPHRYAERAFFLRAGDMENR